MGSGQGNSLGSAQLHSWGAEAAEQELGKFSTWSEGLERPPQRRGCPKALGSALGSGWGAEGPEAAREHHIPAGAGMSPSHCGITLCSAGIICAPFGIPFCTIWDPLVLHLGSHSAPSRISLFHLGSPMPIPHPGSAPRSLQDPLQGCAHEHPKRFQNSLKVPEAPQNQEPRVKRGHRMLFS